MSRPSLWLLAALTIAASVPRTAGACSCIPWPDPRTALASSKAVFEGTITAVSPGTNGAYTAAEVKVLRRWKAPDVSTLIVFTAWGGGGSCGKDFQQGQTYLFYALDDCGLLVASNCTRTRLIADATEDLDALGPPLAPGTEVPDGGGTDGGSFNDAGPCNRPLPDLGIFSGAGQGGSCAIANARVSGASQAWLLALAGAVLALRRRRSSRLHRRR